MPATDFACAELAGGGWACIDFISDLHLQASESATLAAWQRYMQSTPADALFLLGDLFEVWVGDDALSLPFESHCAAILRETSVRIPVYCMHGNRDFLLGSAFLAATHMHALADPTVLSAHGQRYLLTHGDALCLGDTAYQDFRRLVRSPAWQTPFLAQPLAQRQHIAQQLRAQSQSAQSERSSQGLGFSDVDHAEVSRWQTLAKADHVVHGHTHRPFDHALVIENGKTAMRHVLSDWDATANPPRLQVLRLSASGMQRLGV